MTAAMVEHDTFAIGHRTMDRNGRSFRDHGSVTDRWGYVNDKALACVDPERRPPNCDGELYSAKAPGTSFLGFPFYAFLYAAALATGREIPTEEAILYLRFFVVIIPTLLMLLALRRYARENGVHPLLGDLVVIGVALGSMVLTYSHMFAGHQVSAVLLFFCYYAAWRSRDDGKALWPLLSGLAGGLAVCTEYPMALVVLPLFAYQAWVRPRFSSWLLFGLGALPGALLAAWYHWAAFGSPFTTPYSMLENPQFVKDIAPGVMGLRAPKLQNLWDSFLSPYEGLFYFAPWHVLAVLGPAAWFLRAPARTDAERVGRRSSSMAASLAAMAALTLFIACHSLWRGGWTLGPRYIVPFVPFAALALLHALVGLRPRAVRPVAVILVVLVSVSIVVTGACSLVSQGFHTTFFNPFAEAALPLLASGYVNSNVGHFLGFSGLATAVPLLIPVAALLLWGTWRAATQTPSPAQDHSHASETRLAHAAFIFSFSICAASILTYSLTLPAPKKIPNGLPKAYAFTRDNFFVFGASCDEADRLRLHKEAASSFHEHLGIQALRISDSASAGDCKDALRQLRQFSTAEKQSFASRTVVGNIPLVASPIPVSIPIPVTALPTHSYLERR